MNSAEELRAEARRLREAIKNTSDPLLKQEHAARAFGLAIRAEIIAKSSKSPNFLHASIERYRRMLSANDGKTDAEQLLVEAALNDLSEMLQGMKNAAC